MYYIKAVRVTGDFIGKQWTMISAEVAHYAANLVRKTMIDFV